jgi:hypothetical protein
VGYRNISIYDSSNSSLMFLFQKLKMCTSMSSKFASIFLRKLKIICNHFNGICSKCATNFELKFFQVQSFLAFLKFLIPLRKMKKLWDFFSKILLYDVIQVSQVDLVHFCWKFVSFFTSLFWSLFDLSESLLRVLCSITLDDNHIKLIQMYFSFILRICMV